MLPSPAKRRRTEEEEEAFRLPETMIPPTMKDNQEVGVNIEVALNMDEGGDIPAATLCDKSDEISETGAMFVAKSENFEHHDEALVKQDYDQNMDEDGVLPATTSQPRGRSEEPSETGAMLVLKSEYPERQNEALVKQDDNQSIDVKPTGDANNSLKSEMGQIRQQNKALTDTVAFLKIQLDALEKGGENEKKNLSDEHQKAIDDLKGQHEALKERWSEQFRGKVREVRLEKDATEKRLQSELDKVKKDNKFTFELMLKKDQTIKQLEDDVLQARRAVGEVTAEIEERRSERRDLKDRIHQLEVQIAGHNRDHADMLKSLRSDLQHVKYVAWTSVDVAERQAERIQSILYRLPE